MYDEVMHDVKVAFVDDGVHTDDVVILVDGYRESVADVERAGIGAWKGVVAHQKLL